MCTAQKLRKRAQLSLRALMLKLLKEMVEGQNISPDLEIMFDKLQNLFLHLYNLAAGQGIGSSKSIDIVEPVVRESRRAKSAQSKPKQNTIFDLARTAHNFIGEHDVVDVRYMSLALSNLASQDETDLMNILSTLEQLKWTIKGAADGKSALNDKQLREIWNSNVNEIGLEPENTTALFNEAIEKLFVEEGRSCHSQRYRSFLLVNLLMEKSDRYSLSQLSGNSVSYVRLPMQAALKLFRRNDEFKSIVTDFNNENIVSRSVEFMAKYVCNFSNDKKRLAKLKEGKYVVIPTIQTDGVQLHVQLIDLDMKKQPEGNNKDKMQPEGNNKQACHNHNHNSKCNTKEVCKWICGEPEKAANIQTVAAADEGVRYPICVTSIDRSGRKKNYKVKKGYLYQFSTDLSAKIDSAKSDRIRSIESKLQSKESLNLDSFKEGYISTLMEHQETLEGFYGSRKMRRWRFDKDIKETRLYDSICHSLFELCGANQRGSKSGNSSILFVVGQNKTSTDHKNHRPSRHAAFWSYFARKAKALGLNICGLIEFNSSKACMRCFHPVKHDATKHKRVYTCENCGLVAHRDVSSSELHADIVWTELDGYATLWEENTSLIIDINDNNAIKYFRPEIFKTKSMLIGPAENGSGPVLSEQSESNLLLQSKSRTVESPMNPGKP